MLFTIHYSHGCSTAGRAAALKLVPQPHEASAFGLSIVNHRYTYRKHERLLCRYLPFFLNTTYFTITTYYKNDVFTFFHYICRWLNTASS
ncbi:hypothetical protein ACH0B6_18335 [Solibacillus silvestris]